MNNLHTSKYTIMIASAFRADKNEVENAHNSIVASQALANLACSQVQTCIGSWKEKGQDTASTELSFVVPVERKQLDRAASLFIDHFEQDAVLLINPLDYSAYLADKDGVNPVSIGTFQVISEEEAKTSECYTFWRGQYWVAK